MRTVTFTNKQHQTLVEVLRRINNPHGHLMAEILGPMPSLKRWSFREALVKLIDAPNAP